MFRDSLSNVRSDGPVRCFAVPLENVPLTTGTEMTFYDALQD